MPVIARIKEKEHMTHRIWKVRTLKNFVVFVIFHNGVEKEYDVMSLFSEYPQFQVLEIVPSLFQHVKVDLGGYGISWNDEIDLAAEEIWDNGTETGVVYKVDVLSELGVNLAKAREQAGVTQKELADKVHIYQGDISKIERGVANPSVKTLQRLAEGMGMKVKIEFI